MVFTEGEKILTANYNHIHFVGIGGTGMSGIATILLNLGYKVSGSDLKYSETLARLENMGAEVFIGHDESNITGSDLVVISSAIPKTNPEYMGAIKNSIPVMHRADVLSLLMLPKKGIAITGAHGKTTTTSMLSLIMEKNGYNPTVVIGGELNDIGGNATLGKGEYMVAEADESDGSFLKLKPYIAVITNIENDHMDYYKNMDRMTKAFKKFLLNIKDGGFSVLGTDNQNVRKIAEGITSNYFSYGIKYPADYMPQNIQIKGMETNFDLFFKGDFLVNVELHVPGMHNIYNATAALAVANGIGINMKDAADALSCFSGAKRRFQVIGDISGTKIIDDYAHHPTEIMAALNAARSCNPTKIYAIFQPHRYTRTKFLAKEFSEAFEDADEVIITSIYDAGEKAIPGVSAELIYNLLKFKGKKAIYIEDKKDIVDYLIKKLAPGDLAMTIGAGDICDVAYKIVENLRQIYEGGGVRNIPEVN